MVAFNDIRRETAGSDARLPRSASREAGSAANGESRAASPATGPVWHGAAEGAPRPGGECGSIPRRSPNYAHSLPLDGGGELRICAVHGRIEVLARLGKGRVFQTTPLSAERGDTLARRISEIAHIARAQRQAKGG